VLPDLSASLLQVVLRETVMAPTCWALEMMIMILMTDLQSDSKCLLLKLPNVISYFLFSFVHLLISSKFFFRMNIFFPLVKTDSLEPPSAF